MPCVGHFWSSPAFPFLDWGVCFFNIELNELFIYFGD